MRHSYLSQTQLPSLLPSLMNPSRPERSSSRACWTTLAQQLAAWVLHLPREGRSYVPARWSHLGIIYPSYLRGRTLEKGFGISHLSLVTRTPHGPQDERITSFSSGLPQDYEWRFKGCAPRNSTRQRIAQFPSWRAHIRGPEQTQLHNTVPLINIRIRAGWEPTRVLMTFRNL